MSVGLDRTFRTVGCSANREGSLSAILGIVHYTQIERRGLRARGRDLLCDEREERAVREVEEEGEEEEYGEGLVAEHLAKESLLLLRLRRR